MILELKHMICIACPLGCRLNIYEDNNEEGFVVSGNKCSRGNDYAVKEMTNPTRVLTTTVKISKSLLSRVPVRTNGEIPKSLIYEAMKLIKCIEINAPVKIGQVLIDNILNTGVDVVASRSMYETSRLDPEAVTQHKKTTTTVSKAQQT